MLLPAAGCAAVGVALLPLSAPGARSWALALLAAACGAAVSLALMTPRLGPHRYARPDAPHSGLPLRQVRSFEGTALSDGVSGPEGDTTFALRLGRVRGPGGESSAAASGQVLVRVGGQVRVYRGQGVTVRGELRLAAQPGPAAFYSWARPLEVSGGRFGSPLLERRAAWVRAVEAGLGRLDPEVSTLLAALLLGSRGEVSPAMYDRFRASGALHLLALSGLHVGILFALLWGVSGFVHHRAARRLFAVAGVLFYLFLVGVRPSLLRAVIMLAGATAGAVLDRETSPLNLLALAAALVLLLDPWRYADLGCQLSFLSLAGVCLLSPRLSRLLRRWLPRWLSLPLAVSAGAQLGSAPLLLLHFGRIQPIGVVSGVVLIPLVTAFLWTGLAALPLVLVGGPFLLAADRLLRLLYELLRFLLDGFSRAPSLWLAWRSWYWLLFAALLAAVALTRPAFDSRPAERP